MHRLVVAKGAAEVRNHRLDALGKPPRICIEGGKSLNCLSGLPCEGGTINADCTGANDGVPLQTGRHKAHGFAWMATAH
jgi:hypothetical protein